MRKALVVGVDWYSNIGGLNGCVNDAYGVKNVLERHSDGSVNFDVNLQVASDAGDAITRKSLKSMVEDLFADDNEIALFYFAGHGHIETTGGYLCASDCREGDDGLPVSEIFTLAQQSNSKNKIIILDSCHSGIAGARANDGKLVELGEGTTILTASDAHQYASEKNGSGVFTTLLIDALNGAAGNLVGDVSPGSIYAHIDQSLGSWDQRPIFRTNVKSFCSLRSVQPPIDLDDLHKLTEFFPDAGFEFQLDPSFEPESDRPDKENTEIFKVLQRYNRINLLVPVGAPHMYHAAMGSKFCKLTVLGEHYRRLVAENRI